MMGQPVQIGSPMNALSRALNVQGQQQDNALRGMQMRDMQQQRAGQANQQQELAQFVAGLPPLPADAPPRIKAAEAAMRRGLLHPVKYLEMLDGGETEKPMSVPAGGSVYQGGKIVATAPEKTQAPDKPPSAIQEYEYAKGQGYAGSFKDWTTEKARAGAASTSVSYGAPIAGVDANGNPVFFQPDKKGGAPAIVPGVSPPKKDTPAALQEKLAQNAVTLQKIDKALELVSANPDSLGLKNYMGDPVMQRVDPSGVEVRAMIADIGGQKIHDRSGAAVTVGEAERLKPYIPAATDSPAAAKKKLELFRKEYSAMQQAIQSGASVSQAASKNAAASAGGVVNFADLK
jgi:hypothetical protein